MYLLIISTCPRDSTLVTCKMLHPSSGPTSTLTFPYRAFRFLIRIPIFEYDTSLAHDAAAPTTGHKLDSTKPAPPPRWVPQPPSPSNPKSSPPKRKCPPSSGSKLNHPANPILSKSSAPARIITTTTTTATTTIMGIGTTSAAIPTGMRSTARHSTTPSVVRSGMC